MLVVYLGTRAQMFPMFALTSPELDDLSFGVKILDIANHTVLP